MATTGDILGTAISGLLASQRQLTTTSHNISNVNTPGYSRQQVDLVTRPPFATGGGFIGNGVDVASIRRVYDQFLTDQVFSRTSLDSQLKSFESYASQVDNMLSDPSSGLAPVLQDFFNAAQDVADDPTSIPARQLLMSRGDTLTNRFSVLEQRLNDLGDSVNKQMSLMVGDVNSLASSIAKVNHDIVLRSGSGSGRTPPNDLLDQRDQLIEKLSGYVSVSTVEQDDGSLNVFIGNGQNLVLGKQATPLETVNNQYDKSQLEIGIGVGGNVVNITKQLTGGSIGGILDFKSQVLDPSINSLGRVAIGLAQNFNDQHKMGMDLNNQLGGAFFNDLNAVTPLASSKNTGNAVISAAVSDPNALTTGDYILARSGANYTLTNTANNSVTALATFPGGSETVDGITINLTSGALQDGDSFLIRPTRQAANDIKVTISSPDEIAAAAPIRSSAVISNTGNGIVSPGEVLDATNPALLNTVRIQFTSANQFDVVDETSGSTLASGLAYTSGGNVDYNGWRIQISASPQSGDIFRIEQNTGGVSDNRNALKFIDLQKSGNLINGTATYGQAYGQLVGDIGSKTHQAQMNSEAQSALLKQAVEARGEVSGVNLDEEAANLIRFQQSYQAAAQVITIANSVFQSLISAVRG